MKQLILITGIIGIASINAMEITNLQPITNIGKIQAEMNVNGSSESSPRDNNANDINDAGMCVGASGVVQTTVYYPALPELEDLSELVLYDLAFVLRNQTKVNRFFRSVTTSRNLRNIHTGQELLRRIEQKGADGPSFAKIAIEQGCSDIAIFIINRTKNIDGTFKISGRDKSTLLHLAVQNGNVEVVKALINEIQRRALFGRIIISAVEDFLNQQNDLERTALYLAAAEGNSKLVKLLVDAGADKSLKDKAGKSALDMAKDAHNRSIGDIRDRYQQIINILQ